MGIRAAMDALVLIQQELQITEPETMGIAHAYKFVPPEDVVMPQEPTWMNAFTLTTYDRHSSMSVSLWSVHSQLFIGDAEHDKLADIAAAFLEAFIVDMDANSQLNDAAGSPTVTNHFIRGGNPTLAILPRANRPYVGLNLFIDLHVIEGKTFT